MKRGGATEEEPARSGGRAQPGVAEWRVAVRETLDKTRSCRQPATSPGAPERVKVLVLGEPATGKTSLVCTAGGFAKEASLSDSTVAVDFFSFSFAPEDSAPDSRVRLQVWDMSGRAEYEEVRTELYASARESHQVVMLVFNVSQRASFEALAGWARKVHESVPGLVPFVVAANQCDRKQRQVPAEEAAKWCRDRGFALVETSAVTGCGVHELFRAACTVARVCKG